MRRDICCGNIRFNLRNTPITLEILIEIFQMCWVQVSTIVMLTPSLHFILHFSIKYVTDR